MLRMSVLVLCAVLPALVAGCTTTKAKTQTQTTIVQPKNDMASYQRLVFLGKKVAQAMDESYAGFKYGITDSKSANATVDAKQKVIYVTKGLMDLLNDKELMCVLAHEMAHVKHGDYTKKTTMTDTLGILSAVAAALSPAGILLSLVNPVVTNTYSRTQEESADREAAQVLNDRLMISPYACVSAFEQLSKLNERAGGNEGGGILATHPSHEKRISLLKKSWPDAPQVYRIRHIVVSSEKEAKMLLKKLGDGESFADLASAYSLDPLAKLSGGEFGEFEEWELNPSIVKASKGEAGKKIVLFKSHAEYHVVEVTPQ